MRRRKVHSIEELLGSRYVMSLQNLIDSNNSAVSAILMGSVLKLTSN